MTDYTKEEIKEGLANLSDEELCNASGGGGFYESGDEPLFSDGQRVYKKLPNMSPSPGAFTTLNGTVIRNTGKHGRFFPEYKYIVEWDNGGSEEIWEEALTAL